MGTKGCEMKLGRINHYRAGHLSMEKKPRRLRDVMGAEVDSSAVRGWAVRWADDEPSSRTPNKQALS